MATLQGIALVVSGALMDGVETAKLLAVALIPYWFTAALIVSGPRQSPTRSGHDIMVYGYPLLVIAAFLRQSCRSIQVDEQVSAVSYSNLM